MKTNHSSPSQVRRNAAAAARATASAKAATAEAFAARLAVIRFTTTTTKATQ